MSVMCKKPPYCLEEFVAREEMTFDQCAWNAIMCHCFFGYNWKRRINAALQAMWSNQSIAEAQGFRYYIFQYKNSLVEHVVVVNPHEISDFKERISYEHNA